MPLKISSKLKAAIATENNIAKDEVENELKQKSGNKCHLCEAQFNFASDEIEVDHDIPVEAKGNNKWGNLHLAHVECNRFKRAFRSKDVRNLLKFKRFYTQSAGSLDYTAALKFFKVKPTKSVCKEQKVQAHFEFSDNSKAIVPIFSEKHNGYTYRFCFVSIPIGSIFNDDEVQPRLIKMNHAFSIANDLAENPLHEPPACRIKELQDGFVKILMFDGQHKALATWLRHEKSVVFKVYLNMDRERATWLVNSIQSKIKKLPLTPFELAAKLTDEYRDKLEQYEETVHGDDVSEEGFVAWLPPGDRANAKKDIESAVLKEIADEPDLMLTQVVEMRGKKINQPWAITESAYQKKLLKELAHTKPLPKELFSGSQMQAGRVQERANIIRCLNSLYEKVYANLDENSSEQERARAERMSYQSSLKYIATLIRKIVINRVGPAHDELAFVEKAPNEEQWKKIFEAIDRLVSHKVWTSSFDSSNEMKAVYEALQKNQSIDLAMPKVGLTPAYCLKL